MIRDFSDAAKENLIQQVKRVTPDGFLEKAGDYLGDIYLNFRSKYGSLNIEHYVNDVDTYHEKILDCNNTTVEEIERIFEAVHQVDQTCSGKAVPLADAFTGQRVRINTILEALKIPTVHFKPDTIQAICTGQKHAKDYYVIKKKGSISDRQWEDAYPGKTNPEGYRDPDAYREVLRDLDVEKRGRYRPGRDTWCNIYVWDATKAMDCEIPHYYNPATGEGFTREEAIAAGQYSSRNPDGYQEMSALRMTQWLEQHGANNGWVECDADTAIQMANQGYPTVIAATDTNHVGMVAPQNPGESGVQISQAGARNFEHGPQRKGFGNHRVKYYYHK